MRFAGCTDYPDLKPGPTGVSATAGDAEVSLTWSSVTGATSYDVYGATLSGNSVSGYGEALHVSGTSFTKTGLTNGTTYYFVITAQSAAGESNHSAVVEATPVAPTKGPAASRAGRFDEHGRRRAGVTCLE